MAAIAVRIFPLGGKEKIARKRRVKFNTKLIAHRGGCLAGPENTMWTFHRAVAEAHVDVLELDVALTSDGEVVVTHDHDLTRQCGRAVNIHDVSSKELPLLASRIDLHFPSRQRRSYQLAESSTTAKSADGYTLCTQQQPLCLLKEVFDAFPNTPIHLDMKFTSNELVYKTFDMVDKYDRRGLTILGAASGPNVKLMRTLIRDREKHNPTLGHYLTFSSAMEVVWTYVFYYLGILPLIPRGFDAFSIPMMTKAKREFMEERKFGNCCVRGILIWMLHSEALLSHLRRRGIVVLGFVLNDPDEWDEVEHWPIDGIMTDDPVRLYQHMTSCSPLRCQCQINGVGPLPQDYGGVSPINIRDNKEFS